MTVSVAMLLVVIAIATLAVLVLVTLIAWPPTQRNSPELRRVLALTDPPLNDEDEALLASMDVERRQAGSPTKAKKSFEFAARESDVRTRGRIKSLVQARAKAFRDGRLEDYSLLSAALKFRPPCDEDAVM